MRTLRTIAPLVLSLGCAVESRTEFRDIESICVEADESIDDDLWSCDEPLVVDCNTEVVPAEIYVRPEGGSCEGVDLQPVDTPLGPGEHEIVVVDGEGAPVCETTLEIRDTLPPVITTQEIGLWPPNHKLHDITLDDCITAIDDCDPDWVAEVTWVSSDEPDDDNGDGNTSGDVAILGPDAVQLRSERQGGSNGRVYHVGFTVTDGSGNVADGVCDVVVAHDQGKGEAVDDGEAYRIEA